MGRGPPAPQRAATDPSPDWPRPLYEQIKNQEKSSAKPIPPKAEPPIPPPSGALLVHMGAHWCTQIYKNKITKFIQYVVNV